MGSPYDDPTGVIPVDDALRNPVRGRLDDLADRDSFYERHSRRRRSGVEGLDDLEPDEGVTAVSNQDQDPPADDPGPAGGQAAPASAATGVSGRRATPRRIGQVPESRLSGLGTRLRRGWAAMKNPAVAPPLAPPAGQVEPAAPTGPAEHLAQVAAPESAEPAAAEGDSAGEVTESAESPEVAEPSGPSAEHEPDELSASAESFAPPAAAEEYDPAEAPGSVDTAETAEQFVPVEAAAQAPAEETADQFAAVELAQPYVQAEQDAEAEPAEQYVQTESTGQYAEAAPADQYGEAESAEPYVQAESAEPYVQAEPAEQYVEAAPADQYGEAESAEQYVQTEPAEQYVQAEPAEQYVQAESAEQYVQAELAEQYVQAEPAEQYVQAEPAEQYVQAEPAEQYVQPEPVPQFVQAEPIPGSREPRPLNEPDVAEDSGASAGGDGAGKESPEEDAPDDAGTPADDGKTRRGTVDVGVLILRVAVGIAAVVHGLQKLLGWWDGPGLNGFEDILVNAPDPTLGFDGSAAAWLAGLGAIAETAAGAMLIVGLVTPVAASALLGVMLAGAMYKVTLAGGLRYLADTDGGIEYQVLLICALLVILLIGPGRLAMDYGRSWATRPRWGSLALAVLGIAAAVTVWVLFNGTNPLDSPGNPV